MTDSDLTFQTSALKPNADYLAPDGSEIRQLPTTKGGGLCHCTLPAGKTTSPVSHNNVEEIWYVLEGQGEVWRKAAGAEGTVRVSAGTSLTIPPRTAFQFRNTGAGPLCILIVTMPPWPGPQEAAQAVGVWPAGATSNAEGAAAEGPGGEGP
jgi:mannose-6-phosphate isomerase-like protein (cupin superfamily)